MTPKALVFDFDGLVVETESVVLRLWVEEFERHGVEFPTERWIRANVGTTRDQSAGYLDEFTELERLTGSRLDRGEIDARRRQRRAELVAGLRPQPGVERWVAEARERGIRLAVASSSPRAYVAAMLDDLGLAGAFEHLSCADVVGAAKPDPAVYVAALDALSVAPRDAAALEDSPPGVLSARAAGLFVVGVPSEVTRLLEFPGADLVVDSLETFTIDDLVTALEAG